MEVITGLASRQCQARLRQASEMSGQGHAGRGGKDRWERGKDRKRKGYHEDGINEDEGDDNG